MICDPPSKLELLFPFGFPIVYRDAPPNLKLKTPSAFTFALPSPFQKLCHIRLPWGFCVGLCLRLCHCIAFVCAEACCNRYIVQFSGAPLPPPSLETDDMRPLRFSCDIIGSSQEKGVEKRCAHYYLGGGVIKSETFFIHRGLFKSNCRLLCNRGVRPIHFSQVLLLCRSRTPSGFYKSPLLFFPTSSFGFYQTPFVFCQPPSEFLLNHTIGFYQPPLGFSNPFWVSHLGFTNPPLGFT